MYHHHDSRELESVIREKLLHAIKRSSLKQSEIAKKAYISDATLSDYMHKNKLPSLCTFVRLCHVLDIASEEILGI